MEYCPFDIESDPSRFDLETARIRTTRGLITARVSRKRDGRTATLYIHGIGANWSNWTPMLQAESAARLHVHDQVLIDLPGFGDSPNEAGADLRTTGEAVLEAVSALGYEKIRIVGHSMGGFVALDMASRNSGQIESLHLVAGSYFSMLQANQHPLSSCFRTPSIAAIFNVYYQIARTGKFGTQMVRALYALGISRTFLRVVASHPLRLRRSVVKALCYQYNPSGIIRTAKNQMDYDAYRYWARIQCPIWAVFADRDRIVPPRDMRQLLRCRPGVKSAMLTDSGHMVHVERPFEVLDALKLWDRTAIENEKNFELESSQ
jgi:pimeloyl-ACP methyl ester carboxylesterase